MSCCWIGVLAEAAGFMKGRNAAKGESRRQSICFFDNLHAPHCLRLSSFPTVYFLTKLITLPRSNQ